MITVQVRLYATLRRYRPEVKLGESLPMELPEGTTVGQLIARLGIPAEVVKIIFVNHCQQGPEHVLQNGDEVAIFPPSPVAKEATVSTRHDLIARLQAAATPALGPDGQERRLVLLTAVRRIAQQTGASRREVEIAALREHILPARYERNLGTVGWEGQSKLLESTVAVVGAGGLGGWIIEGLARMGVGRLIVIDGDVFAENNLNRQALCTEASLGHFKAEVAAERVAAVNAAVEVTVYARIATAETMPQLLHGAQVVVDALDSLPTRLMLQEACRVLGVPMVHGAIAGYMGQVTTIFPGDTGLRALYGDNVPEQGIERQLGNPAGTPLMVAAWQVQETIKLLLGSGEPLRGRLLLLDAEAGTAEIVKLG